MSAKNAKVVLRAEPGTKTTTRVMGGHLAPTGQRLSVDSAAHFDGHVQSLNKRMRAVLIVLGVFCAVIVAGLVLTFVIVNSSANDNTQALANLQAHVAGLEPAEKGTQTYTVDSSQIVSGLASWFNVSKDPAASPDHVCDMSFPTLASSNGTTFQAAQVTLDSSVTTAYGSNVKPVSLPSLPAGGYLVTGQVTVQASIPRPTGGSNTPGAIENETTLVLIAGTKVVAESVVGGKRDLQYNSSGYDTVVWTDTLRFAQVVHLTDSTSVLRVAVQGTKSGTTLTADSYDYESTRSIVGDAAATFLTVVPLPNTVNVIS